VHLRPNLAHFFGLTLSISLHGWLVLPRGPIYISHANTGDIPNRISRVEFGFY
jgi:hypothetical protein